MIVSMELVALMQLLLLQTGIVYCSVLQMNAIRQAGLVCAVANGFYALYVLERYSNEPGAGSTCATSYVTLELGDPALSSASGSSEGSTRLVADYTTFVCLLAVNILCGIYGMPAFAQSCRSQPFRHKKVVDMHLRDA